MAILAQNNNFERDVKQNPDPLQTEQVLQHHNAVSDRTMQTHEGTKRESTTGDHVFVFVDVFGARATRGLVTCYLPVELRLGPVATRALAQALTNFEDLGTQTRQIELQLDKFKYLPPLPLHAVRPFKAAAHRAAWPAQPAANPEPRSRTRTEHAALLETPARDGDPGTGSSHP